ncbi:MAG: hypothetical protein ABJA71_09685 [Ginsengibacter sp.]
MTCNFHFPLTNILLVYALNGNNHMKAFFFLTGLLYASFCLAQKNYEFTDTRKKTESFKKMQQKDIRADLASFTLAGIDESVGKADLKKVSFKNFGLDSMKFEGDNIKATVTLAPFDAAKHKLEYDEKYLIKIDRKTYYGGYGSLPTKYISHVIVTVGNDTLSIPLAAYADLYNLNLTYMDKGVQRTANAIYFSKDGHKLYFYLLCKDVTGSYEVTWIIQDKKYLRRVLDYGIL